MTTTLKIKDYDNCVFDEDGKPITIRAWSEHIADSNKYYRESVVNGFTIRTYWTGVDMPHPARLTPQFNYSRWTPNDPPLIFEGVVYNQDMLPIYRGRYTDRDQAYVEHSQLLKEYKNK